MCFTKGQKDLSDVKEQFQSLGMLHKRGIYRKFVRVNAVNNPFYTAFYMGSDLGNL